VEYIFIYGVHTLRKGMEIWQEWNDKSYDSR
jgi:hypothetical protein